MPQQPFRLHLVPALLTTRQPSDRPPKPNQTHPEVGEVRLALANWTRSGAIDGAWWPWPRPVAGQLSRLIEAVGKARGTEVGDVRDDGTLQLTLNLADGNHVVLLVVPPDFNPEHAQWAMAKSIEPDNELGPYELLRQARAEASQT